MSRGDVIYVKRPGYKHYGVDVGGGYVAHFNGFSSDTARIVVTTEYEFASPSTTIHQDYFVEYAYDKDEVAERALRYKGSSFGGYDLVLNNCEHFANFCASGQRVSRQAYFVSDDKTVIEKALDNGVSKVADIIFDPLIKLGSFIDDIFGL